MAVPVLMQWGFLQFKTYPLEYHEMDHATATDWARKEIAGAAIYREWVGENDEELFLRGTVFPFRLGGLTETELIESMRRAGMAALMMRGGGAGTKLGWFVCERFIRQHRVISEQGYGRQINFEANFARVPVPSADDAFTDFWQMVPP